MDFLRKNTGQVSKPPYEGVVTRFNRLYLNRDIGYNISDYYAIVIFQPSVLCCHTPSCFFIRLGMLLSSQFSNSSKVSVPPRQSSRF